MKKSSKTTPQALVNNQYRQGILNHLQLYGFDESRENLVAISHWNPKILELHSKNKAITAQTKFPRVVSLELGKEIGLVKSDRSQNSNSSLLDSYVNVPSTTPAAFNEYLDTVFINQQIDLLASGGPLMSSSTRLSLSSSAGDKNSVEATIARRTLCVNRFTASSRVQQLHTVRSGIRVKISHKVF